MHPEKTIYDQALSDPIPTSPWLTRREADQLFTFFKQCRLFRWQDVNNDCEDRANAACMLLDQWNLPACKAWVFSGSFLKRDGGQLRHQWKYHVAAALPVKEEDALSFFILDPATLSETCTIAQWAAQITDTPNSYHFVKSGEVYIFNPANLTKDFWYKQNRQNYKWTLQGLAGINGVSRTGKAQLVFNKSRIAKTQKAFQQLLQNKPDFISGGFSQ